MTIPGIVASSPVLPLLETMTGTADKWDGPLPHQGPTAGLWRRGPGTIPRSQGIPDTNPHPKCLPGIYPHLKDTQETFPRP